jgi:hypothetical protein
MSLYILQHGVELPSVLSSKGSYEVRVCQARSTMKPCSQPATIHPRLHPASASCEMAHYSEGIQLHIGISADCTTQAHMRLGRKEARSLTCEPDVAGQTLCM